MTEGQPPSAQSSFDRAHAVRAIGFSIVVNAVLPYLIYRVLEPRFPADSLTPLVVSTVFPVFGLAFGIIRRKAIDYIAVIVLVEIGITILVTLAASSVRFALEARALQGTLTGLFFLATIPIGHPILYHIARQFVAAGTPEVVAGFEARNRQDHGRTFRRLTAIWGIATIGLSFVNLYLATAVGPATYLLVTPTLGIGMNTTLIAWTIGYASRRFARLSR